MLKDKMLLYTWLPQAVIVTILCGLFYISNQQVLRQFANDPQIQLAEDWVHTLNYNGAADELDAVPLVDISKSLSPFIIIYNSSGRPLKSSGRLYNKIPVVPASELQSAKGNGQNRITWEPDKGIKIAAVIIPYKSKTDSGFILAGRSLREVQVRISKLDTFCAMTWGVLLSITFFINFFIKFYVKEKNFR